MGWVLMTLHFHFIHGFGYIYVQVIWLLHTIETHWMDKLPLLSYLHQEVKRLVKSKYTLNFWILYIRHENEGMSFICDKKSEQTEVARAILRWGKKWKSPWDGGDLKVAAPWSRPAGGRPPTGPRPCLEWDLKNWTEVFGFQITLVMVLYACARKKHLGG